MRGLRGGGEQVGNPGDHDANITDRVRFAISLAAHARALKLQARLEIGLVETILLGFFEAVRAQSHRAIFAEDLPVAALVQILEMA